MNENLPGFEVYELGVGCRFWVGQLPPSIVPNPLQLAAFWQMHPVEFHEIMIHGRLVKTPRWQQAYGADYHYTGRVNTALPTPSILVPFLNWARENIDPRLNGLLLNWYDGRLGHYISRHRDSIKHMIPGAPIVTMSFGEERTFRLRHWPTTAGQEPKDFIARSGSVFVMPWDTNRCFTHEVIRSKIRTGKRLSITLRAFEIPIVGD